LELSASSAKRGKTERVTAKVYGRKGKSGKVQLRSI